MIEILFAIAGMIFAIAAVIAVIRAIRGPSLLDRVLASDVLVTTLLLAIGAEMVINGHNRNIVIMLAIAATAGFGTIAIARYLAQQSLDREDSDR